MLRKLERGKVNLEDVREEGTMEKVTRMSSKPGVEIVKPNKQVL